MAYAEILSWVSLLGMIFLGLGFFIYLMQMLPSTVSIQEISQHWHLKASDFTHQLHIPTGWAWIDHIFHGDILSYASIVFLSTGTIGCLAIVAVVFFREKNHIYTAIAIAQVLILLLAASGIVSSGH